MQVLAEFGLDGLRSAESAKAALASNPELADRLEALSGGRRCGARRRIAAVCGIEAALELLPSRPRGRPVAYSGRWAGIPAPARASIASALGVPELSEDAAAWTPEAASTATDAITKAYSNATTVATLLTGLRNCLRELGASDSALRATARPHIVAEHNARINLSRSQRVARGLDVPEPYARLELLRERAEAFISDATGATTPQAAADLLVILSARPGEANTLEVGAYGGLVGALKKRAVAAGEYPILSALGARLATEYLRAWKLRTSSAKRQAMSELPKLCASWGIQTRDLRAIGAALAVRHATIGGSAQNSGQARDVHRAALRHEEVRTAQDHYERVNDPTAALCARIADLKPEARARVEALLTEVQ